jgi:hypothetical protein
MKNGKNKKTIIQQPNIFLNLDVKKYFYCLKIYEKKKKKLLNNSKFYLLRR